ncbi:predicted protein [Naegleria gruberi]|uniref:Predicted protein n=1 Tax=Naegleria gruberi TaxID=5762 RepID=D2VP43_NAEGR|nr:uncharacterized protein NAEGRDRAFT_70725 [Naegleria gruberi]EFC41367.1 predicted protein [Naegleria gruberi]|eukprot:XP_002674111.1 predicted protein [Naegleria gruberi strain NEG-M]
MVDDLIVIENSPYFLCYSLYDFKGFKLMKVHEDGKITFVKDLEKVESSILKESDFLIFHQSMFKLNLTSEMLESRSSISCFQANPGIVQEGMGGVVSPSTHGCQLLSYNVEEGSGSVISYGGSLFGSSFTSSKIIRFDFSDQCKSVTRGFESSLDVKASFNSSVLIAGRYLISFCGYYRGKLIYSERIGIFDCLYNCRIGHFTLDCSEEEKENLLRINPQSHYQIRSGNRILLFGGIRRYLLYNAKKDIGFNDISFFEMKLPTFVLPPLKFSKLATKSYNDIMFEF